MHIEVMIMICRSNVSKRITPDQGRFALFNSADIIFITKEPPREKTH